MKIFVAILLTALTTFVAGLYLPWWSLAITAFLSAVLVRQGPVKAFLSGFLGVFLLWALLAWWIDFKNEGLLSARIVSLLPLGGSSIALILVTSFVGGLVAGFAAITGSYLFSTVKPQERSL